MLYRIHQGTVSLGGETVLDHIDFHIKGKEKVALVGRNGSGKTTLLKLIAGQLDLDRDDKRQEPGIWLARDTSIGLLSQSAFSGQDREKTVEDLIMALCPARDPFSREYYDFLVEYRRMFTGLGFDACDSKRQIGSFSGGEQTRIALIGLLLTEPDILLLDEPTNHLDLKALDWLEGELVRYNKAVVLVSHDRYFLDQTVEAVWELSQGRLRRYPGNYTAYRSQSRKLAEDQKKKYEAQQQEIARLTALIEKYKHKPTKASMARSKRKFLERMERIEKPSAEQTHIFTGEIQPRERGSKRVLTTEKLKIGYGKQSLPLNEISLSIRRGQKIGIIGENGTGKTTFLKTLAGKLPPVSGSCQTGLGIHMEYYDQLTGQITSGQRVFEHFCEHFPSMTVTDAKRTLGHYLFTGDDTGKRITDLSGGEKSRLYLAELLTAGPNLMLLDEPTNHMDIPAKETLESAFMAYTGTLLFISHDRYFVKQVADSLLVFEKDKVLYYPFGYAHYQERLKKMEDHRRRAGDDAGSLAGTDTTLVSAIRAENTRMVQELKAVPDRKRMQSSRLNTEQSYTDWQLTLAAEGLARCRQQIEKKLASLEEIRAGEEYWWDIVSEEEPPAEIREIQAGSDESESGKSATGSAVSDEEQCMNELENVITDYHQACLLWYDKYLEYKEAFRSYRE